MRGTSSEDRRGKHKLSVSQYRRAVDLNETLMDLVVLHSIILRLTHSVADALSGGARKTSGLQAMTTPLLLPGESSETPPSRRPGW